MHDFYREGKAIYGKEFEKLGLASLQPMTPYVRRFSGKFDPEGDINEG